MINKSSEYKSLNLIGKIVKGVVIENKDPLLLGRLKIKNDILFPSNISDDLVPWVMPLSFNSAINGQCNVNIPDIGTICLILYTSDDIYSGIYLTGVANLSNEFLDDYPYCYGFIDRSGSLFIVNTKTDNYTFYHVSGTRLNIDGYGRVKFQVANNNESNDEATTNNNKGLTVEVIGDINASCTGDYNLKCTNFNLDATNSVNINTNAYKLSSSSISLNASADIELLSSNSIVLSSNSSTSIASNETLSLAGSSLGITSTSTSGSVSMSASSGYIGNSSGHGISFGDGRTQLDSHPLKDFTTDVSHTPFIAFDPATIVTPPSPPSPPSIKDPNITLPIDYNIIPQQARKRQAYSGDNT